LRQARMSLASPIVARLSFTATIPLNVRPR
jgi:hypothetical protein